MIKKHWWCVFQRFTTCFNPVITFGFLSLHLNKNHFNWFYIYTEFLTRRCFSLDFRNYGFVTFKFCLLSTTNLVSQGSVPVACYKLVQFSLNSAAYSGASGLPADLPCSHKHPLPSFWRWGRGAPLLAHRSWGKPAPLHHGLLPGQPTLMTPPSVASNADPLAS